MPNPAERRRSTRVEVLGRIHGEVIALGTPLEVREISLGGMSVETPKAFPIGAVNDFLLTLGDGAGVEVLGKVVYSRVFDEPDRRYFVSGIQFIDQDELDPSTPVGGLINRVT
jgi:hypothetical protein